MTLSFFVEQQQKTPEEDIKPKVMIITWDWNS